MESFDEAYCRFCFIGNYDSRCVLEAGSDTSMGHAVFPRACSGFLPLSCQRSRLCQWYVTLIPNVANFIGLSHVALLLR
jgi:hypothetical protein